MAGPHSKNRRKLLAASVGVATLTVAGCGGFFEHTTGNLMAPACGSLRNSPYCPDGGLDGGPADADAGDAGETDAGSSDAGETDGG